MQVLTRGPDPRTIVPEPTWEELDASLQGEIGFVEEHLDDAPAFGVLNLCRILYSYEARDVVVGKLQAAVWAHASLDVDLHATIRIAVDAYRTRTFTLAADVTPFCEAVLPRIHAARVRADRYE